MGSLASIIDNAVDSVLGSSSGTSLQDFLANFSSSDGKWVSLIDPLGTFDLSFKFYPGSWSKSTDGTWYENLGSSLVSSAKSAVKSAANSVTGGLLGSIMNNMTSVQTLHDSFSEYGSHTFLEYLAAANLLVGKEDWFGESAGLAVCPLELQLGLYCQEITIPNIEVPAGQNSTTVLGEFPINGTYVKPDTNTLTMKFLNTRVPLHERIFYPWMREVTLPYWSYATQPYTTATVTIDMSKHSDISYVFCGCRPQKIISQTATHDPGSGNITRDVSFLFDYMFVMSKLKTSETLTEKILNTGTQLFNSASKLVNL